MKKTDGLQKKAGGIAEAVPENVKLGRTGINKGFGANTLYFKHVLEDKRSKVFIFDTSTIVFLIMNIIFAFFPHSMGVIIYFAMTTYMMMFSVFTGRWIKELVRSYIFLIPEPPLKKQLFCLIGSLKHLTIEAALLYAIAVPILGLTFFDFILLTVARISFGLIFLISNLFVDRFSALYKSR